jgi:3'-5' exoribonuclease
VKELGDELVPDYTDDGHFVGHTVLGRDMVRESAAGMKDFPSDLLSELEHMILCHEGAF